MTDPSPRPPEKRLTKGGEERRRFLRSMAVVTQQLERMLDVLRENARQESTITQTELGQVPGK